MRTERTGEASETARLLFARPWSFLLSVTTLADLPAEGPVEIAFAGRSNVGKSSLINAICGQKDLARTSNVPGRTQQLNFFFPSGSGKNGPPLFLVDLPGYGYAKAPMAEVEKWTRLVLSYLRARATLKRVFLLIDSRHGIKPNDIDVMDLLDRAAVSYQAVLTKTDKIPPATLAEVKARTAQLLRPRPAAHPHIVASSAETGAGIEELRGIIAGFLGHEACPPEQGDLPEND